MSPLTRKKISSSSSFLCHMINFHQGNKMLRNLIIFSLCFVAIRASGEFSVLSSPKSIGFHGNDALPSENVADVLDVAMGNDVDSDAQWPGLTVNEPFTLGQGGLIVLEVDGVSHFAVGSNAKTYEMTGNANAESLSGLINSYESRNVENANIDFNNFEEAVIAYHSYFGDAAAPAVASTKHLNSALHSEDKDFLASLGFINAIADNLSTMEKNCNVLFVRLSLAPIAKAHGEKTEAFAEAVKHVSVAAAKLTSAAQKSSNNAALVVGIASKTDEEAATSAGRVKREVISGNAATNTYNLAEYYNQDYPVIFNIILWFMVTFGFALLAICYAIGSMDPGRDSIIYRMTSTRMKKDM